MSAIRLTRVFFLVATIVLVADDCLASAFVRGAYYRLGEDDPGAMAGSVGNDPTQDSFGDDLDLKRFGSPRYWADVPPRGPFGSTLSMAFANEGLGGPAFPGLYGRDNSLLNGGTRLCAGGLGQGWANKSGFHPHQSYCLQWTARK